MPGRFLRMFQPFARIMPAVSSPKRRVGFNEKIFWTAMALVIYLIMNEVPLYKVAGGGWDLSYLRIIFASNRGTLMELGIGPIVTAGLVLQLLAGSGIVTVNFSDSEDKALFTTASKVFSVLMIGVQASAYLIGGVYGTIDAGTAVIIFLQLLCAGLIIMLLDEMIQKGWGIGSGISLFILAGVTQRVVWDSLAMTPPWEDGKSWGAFIALFQTLANRESLVNALIRVDSGGNILDRPSLLGFAVTVAVFIIVIYLEGIRVDVPISYAQYRGFRGKYPVKLLYVSNLPVIFASTLFSNIFFFSQLLWSRLGQPAPGTNFWLDLFGQYVITNGQPHATGGLAYYVTSPRSIAAVMTDPWRALAFAGIMIAFSIVFSRTWLEVGGSNPRSVANQLVESGMQIPGFRRSGRSIELVLKRYIPVVAVLGGAIIGLIAAVADFLGVFGTGMGILLAVGILYQYYQLLMQEQVAEMYPAFGRVLGG